MPEKTPENTAINSPASSKISAEFISQIASLCDEWDKTENWIKRGELISSKASIPSINEMRYAGRQLVDACRAAQSNSNTERHLLEARSNLLKARHDVVDFVVAYISDNANNHKNRLDAGNLQKYFPNYGELFGLLKTITDKIPMSRESRTRRDEIYGEIMENDLSNLINLYNELGVSLPAIEQNIKKDSQKGLIPYIIAIVATLSLALSLTVTFFQD